MRKTVRTFCWLGLFLFLSLEALGAAPVRVGVYQDEPLVFTDERGVPRGFFIDILDEVAGREGWRLEYRSGTWSEALEWLQTGAIDILPAVAYSEEGAEIILHTRDSLLADWGEVYAAPGEDIRSVFDLRGKRAGLVAGDMHSKAFKDLLEKFQVSFEPVEYASYKAVFQAMDAGQVEAGVVNRIRASRMEDLHRARPTPIVFDPVEIRFGVSKLAPAGLLAQLDHRLGQFKADRNSPYYAALDRWFGAERQAGLPAWAVTAIWGAGAGLLFLIGVSLVLRRRVHRKTRELLERNRELEREVVERRRAEDALQTSRAHLRLIADSLPVFIAHLDADRNYLFINRAYAAELDAPVDRIVGSHARAVLGEAIYEAARERMDAVLAGKVVDCDLELATEHGPRYVRERYIPHLAEQGAADSFFVLAEDTTQAKEAEKELIRAKEAAEAASHAKSVFLATMSHEIRTPLNGVLGMLQLLQMAELGGENMELVDTALGSGRSLLHILNDILDLSAIEAGKLQTVRAAFHLEDVIAPVLQALKDTAERKGLRLECDPLDGLPPVLLGDEGRVRQILFNLVGNAVKFTESGEVRLEVHSLQPLRPNELRALFIVSDTGIGIPDAMLGEVFKAFTQADAAATRKYPGTGLGLGLVERLVKLLGGALCIESEVGKGTSVCLVLDFGLPERRSADGRPLPASTGSLSRTILVVEDDEISREFIVLLLRTRGYDAQTARDGREALEVLAERRFGLVLMDIRMPVVDGPEATRRIRNGEVAGCPSDIPIVAITAHAMKGDRERFLAMGMDDYLAKPVDAAQLFSLVVGLIGKAAP